MKTVLRTITLAAAIAVAAPALAQSNSGASAGDTLHQPGGLFDATPHTRSNQLSVWGAASWWYGLGIGARYKLPIMADGFLPELNDSVEVEAGGDFFFGGGFGYGYSALDIPVEGRWTFHVIPNLSLYAKVGLGLTIEFGRVTGTGIGIGGLFNVGPGLEYEMGTFVLRAEAGYRGGKIGVGFNF